jgi:cytochrome c-type biogenesis protein CcmE
VRGDADLHVKTWFGGNLFAASAVLVGMVYRDELVALAARRKVLERELRDLEDGSRELATRRGLCEAELTAVCAALDGRRSLPILDTIQVASPCNVSWGSMTGDLRVRFCGGCGKSVYNLSAMSRAEAEALLREKAGLCTRLYRKEDGTVLTADCPVGVRTKRLRGAVAVVAAGALIGGAALGSASPETQAVSVRQLVFEGKKLAGHHRLRAEGTLVHGTLTKQESPCGYLFQLEDQGTRVLVRYAQCVVPDNFRDVPGLELGVVVDGELSADKSFAATAIFAKSSQGARYLQRSEPTLPAKP